jgi:TPR repeat protein
MARNNPLLRGIFTVSASVMALTALPAVAGPDEDMMILANAAYYDEEYQDAFDIWKPLADKGNMQAQMELANAYEHCDCIANGTSLAIDYYRMAGKKGNLSAIRQIGWIYSVKGNDEAEAAIYYKIAADMGDAESQVELGDLYRDGLGGAATLAQMPKYYLMATAQGDKAGYSRMGYVYSKGVQVPADPIKAYVAYAMAAALYFPMSKEKLAEYEKKLSAKQLVKAKVLVANCVKAKYLKCL